MSRTLPPTFTHWPVELVSAALLSGALLKCGPGVRPAGWPDIPITRLSALNSLFDDRYTAIGDTAAWVWCARQDPGPTIMVSTRHGRVPANKFDNLVRKQLRFHEGDLMCLGNGWVTTPLRTAFDLLRLSPTLTHEQQAAVRLLLKDDETHVGLLLERARESSKADCGRVATHLARIYRANW